LAEPTTKVAATPVLGANAIVSKPPTP